MTRPEYFIAVLVLLYFAVIFTIADLILTARILKKDASNNVRDT